MRQDLNGTWTLHIPHLEADLQGTVPGSVYSDLLAHGLIPDPYAKDNEYVVREWMRHDYVYTRTFMAEVVSGLRTYVRFQSLDTIATVKVNGKTVLESDNMHIRHLVEITSVIISGKNTIEVTLHSPIRAIQDAYEKRDVHLFEITDAMKGYSLVRKAHSMFGWDWGPQLPDAGIQGDVALIMTRAGVLGDPDIRQTHNEGMVTLDVAIPVHDPNGGTIVSTVKDPHGKVLHKAFGQTFSVDIGDPELWWPRGYGAQPLYTLDVTLTKDNLIQDSGHHVFGLLTHHVRRDPDAHGESFVYVHNGTDVFMKGANYIIEDNILARMDKKRTERLIDDAIFANLNTIRVWGGGLYPPDWFYEICDRKGMLVWQDLMFACSGYDSGDNAFMDSVEREVKDVSKRIKNHPSIALLCGNNEVETAIEDWNIPHQELTKKHYLELFENKIPEWIDEIGWDIFYWPSSPSSGGGFDKPNDHARGDMHDWSVWHANKPVTHYRRHITRFMSEFGIQSFPELKTVRTFAEEKDFKIHSKVMKSHQKNKTANKKILFYMRKMFRMPTSFEDILDVSQLVQAEGVRQGVEHFRRHHGITMGSLYWQLNDCWPVASWSSIDYEGRYKALHYASRRFYADILVSAAENRRTMTAEVVVTNDTRQPFSGTLMVRVLTTGGQILDLEHHDVTAGPSSATRILTLDHRKYREIRKQCVTDLVLMDDSGTLVSANTITYVDDKDLELHDGPITTDIRKDGNKAILTLSSEVVKRFVRLRHEDDRFSDNVFHLLPGRSVTVTLDTSGSEDEIRKNLVVKSLIDTY